MCRGVLGVVVHLSSQLARLGPGVSGTFAGGEKTVSLAWKAEPSPLLVCRARWRTRVRPPPSGCTLAPYSRVPWWAAGHGQWDSLRGARVRGEALWAKWRKPVASSFWVPHRGSEGEPATSIHWSAQWWANPPLWEFGFWHLLAFVLPGTL